MLKEIVNSIYEPGVSPRLLVAVNVIFCTLLLTGILILTLVNFSYHVLGLTLLALALVISINWFVNEIAVGKDESKKQS